MIQYVYKKEFFFKSLFLCLFISFSQFTQAENLNKNNSNNFLKHNTLTVCTESGYLPLEMRSTSGLWLGFDPDMMKAFAAFLSTKSSPIQLIILDTKWDGIIPSLMTKRCDLIASSMAVTKERAAAVAFSDLYYKNELLIATKNTPENQSKYKNISNFNKAELRIAVKTGSSPDLYLQKSRILNRAIILRYDADADTLSAVLNGRADAFIYDTPYVRLAAINNPGKLYVIPKGFNGDEFAVAFRKQDNELKNIFNKFLAQWKREGAYTERLNYYFKGQTWVSLLDK